MPEFKENKKIAKIATFFSVFLAIIKNKECLFL